MAETPTREQVSEHLFRIFQAGVKSSYAQTQGRIDDSIDYSGRATGLILEVLAVFDARAERMAELGAVLRFYAISPPSDSNGCPNGGALKGATNDRDYEREVATKRT